MTISEAGADSYTTTLEAGQFKMVGNPSGLKSAAVGRGAWAYSAQGGTVTVTAQ